MSYLKTVVQYSETDREREIEKQTEVMDEEEGYIDEIRD